MHVKKAFFKELPAGQRGDPEEEKRYNEVENFIWHIQIEMELPAGHKPSLGEEDIEEEEVYKDLIFFFGYSSFNYLLLF